MEGVLKTGHQHWVHTWTAMPQLAELSKLPPPPFTQERTVFSNTTLRQTVRISIAGTSHLRLRLRLSNAFGHEPLNIAEATIARSADNASGTNAIQPDTVCHLTFSGERDTRIPVGAQIVSDPVDCGLLPPASAVSISLFLPDGQQVDGITSHPGSRTTSWFSHGNQVSEKRLSGASVGQVEHWYYISGIEVLASRESSAFVLIGDSITDGRCSTTNGDTRWPDFLFARLQKQQRTSFPMSSIAVISQAAGGNQVLEDGMGPNVLARLDRDVLALSGLRFAMIYEGVNDIGIVSPDPKSQAILEKRLIAGYVQVATRLRAAGITVLIATLTPFGGREEEDKESGIEITSYSHPVRETTRQNVNAWIRSCAPSIFDAVVDFDAVLRDPENPSVLAREYDSGDHLHPNEMAFQTLAASFPLAIFSL